MEKKTYKPIASYTADMLGKVREQIIDGIVGVLNFLGGKVCVAYYTDEAEAVNRMTFFETKIDGYGTELFVRDIELTEDGLKACLEDSESAYSTEWGFEEFNASNAQYLLEQLEDIAEYVQESGEEVVTEWDW